MAEKVDVLAKCATTLRNLEWSGLGRACPSCGRPWSMEHGGYCEIASTLRAIQRAQDDLGALVEAITEAVQRFCDCEPTRADHPSTCPAFDLAYALTEVNRGR
jgi:hypothetical protein